MCSGLLHAGGMLASREGRRALLQAKQQIGGMRRCHPHVYSQAEAMLARFLLAATVGSLSSSP